MEKRNGSRCLRVLSLGGFVAFTTWVAWMHQVKGGGTTGVPSVDALCPMGGLETFQLWATAGDFLRRTAPSALILFLVVGLMTLLLGRVFCGWICPMGAISEFFGFAGRKLRLPRVRVPGKLDKALKLLKYGVLFAILWGTFSMGTLIWRDLDPWVAWAHLSAGWDGILERPWAYLVLFAAVIGAPLFIERFWCRYLCPLGAALGILSLPSPTRVGNTAPETCSDCGLCYAECPVQLAPEKGPVPKPECLACGKCVEAQLSECGVRVRFAEKSTTVLTVGIIALAVFFGGYAAARVTGYWTTYVPPKVSDAMTPEQVADSVYGWMSLKQVAETTGIPVEKIKKHSELSADVSETESMRTLGIDDEKVREAIKELAVQTKTTRSTDSPASSGTSTPSVAPNPAEIKGSATLLDLRATYGLEPAAILKEAGWPEDLSADVPLKELKTVLGKEVEDLRGAVKRLLPK